MVVIDLQAARREKDRKATNDAINAAMNEWQKNVTFFTKFWFGNYTPPVWLDWPGIK